MDYLALTGGGQMPVIGLGTWQLQGKACIEAVRDALDIGYRHIDTAAMYGNEAEIGEAIAAAGVGREELFLTTKIWTDHFRAADVVRSTDASLRKLRTEYVDLLLMHWPNEAVPLKETLGAMAKIAIEGKARAIGVSNFPGPLLEAAIAASPVPIACDQVKCHVGFGQGPLLKVARRRGVVVTAYSPLARGSLVRDANLRKIAEKHRVTPGQVALRWLIEQEGVAAIPKAASLKNLHENFALFEFSLDPEDRALLDAASG
jgi:2,5-diketo-D-gluconate reductase B